MAGVAAVNDWVTPPEVDDWVTPPEAGWRGPAGEVDPRVPFAKPFAGADTAAIAKAGQFETALAPDEESAFQAWKQQYAPQDSGADYDLRGAFKAGLMPDPVTGHWPDTFKKPNHPTFSDQSQYASARPDLAGTWDGDVYVPPQGRTALGWLDRTLEPVFPKEAMGHAASQYTGDIAKSWEQLKTDFMKQFPDPAMYKKAGFWEQQKQNFEGLLATGKSVVDAFNLAMSPVSAAFDVATTGIDAGAHAIVPGTTPGMLKDALDQSLIGIGPEGGLLGATAKVRTAAEAGRAAADFVNAAAPDESTLRLPAPKETAKAEENPTPRNGATAPPKDDWVTPPETASAEEPWLAPVDLEPGTEPTPPLEEAPKKRVATDVDDAHKRDVAALTAEAVKNATTPGGEDFGAQAAAVAARQAKPKPSKPAKPSLGEKEGELLDQIRARGGINVTQGDHADIPEILKDYKNPPFKRRLLNPNGLLPDEMRKSLQSDGWFGGSPDKFGPTALAVGNYPGDDIRDLAGKISDSVNGTPVYHPEAAPPERAYDPVEHEHFLQGRANAVGAEPRRPAETLEDFDARIAEREAIVHEPAAMTDLADEREAEQHAGLDPWHEQYDPLDRAFDDQNRRTAKVSGEPQSAAQDAGTGEEAGRPARGPSQDVGDGKEAEGDREDEIPSPGTRQSPVELHHEDDIGAARAEVEPNPSEGQREAGNYSKGHVRIHGMDVAIETPKGTARTGTGGDGKPWSNVNGLADYGYIKRTEGADGEHVDTYIGHNPASDKAFVFDQYDPKTGVFDEHKSVLGVDTAAQAKAVYDAGFSDGSGPSRRKAMRQMSVPEFKDYLANGDLTKPAAPVEAKVARKPASPPVRGIANKLSAGKPLKEAERQALYNQYFKPGRIVEGYGGRDLVTTAPRFGDQVGTVGWEVGVKEVGKDGVPRPGERERFHSTAPYRKALIAFVRSDEFKEPESIAKLTASPKFQRATEEPGAEDGHGNALPQKVIPGAERLTEEELRKRDLARRMEGKQQGKPGQKAVHGLGLFGGEAEATAAVKKKDQGSLFQRGKASASGTRREIAPGNVVVELSDEAKSARDELAAAARKQLDKLGFKDIAVKVVDRIHGLADGTGGPSQGYYFARVITAALKNTVDRVATINHEVVHGARDLDVFNPMEWAILANASKKRWMAHYDIVQEYAGLPRDVQIEEGIAHRYSDPARRNEPAGIQRLFAKVSDTLSAIGNVFRGLGFDTPERIFKRLDSGEIGARQRPGVGALEEGPEFQRNRKPAPRGPVPPYTPRSNAAPGQGGLGGIGKPPPPNVPPPPAGGGQGGLSLPSVAEPVGKKLTDWEDDLHRITKSNERDQLKALQWLQGLPKEVRDTALQEKFYLHKEEGTPLTAAEQKLYDKYVAPIMKQAQDTWDRIRESGAKDAYPVNDPNYIHRIVKGRGSMYDEPQGALGSNPIHAGGRSLSKKAPSLNGRQIFMSESDKGTKQIVYASQGYKPGDAYANHATGENFKVRQAKTREIEARTNVRYHKNALVNSLDNLTRLRRAERNIQFLEHLKKDPTFLENAHPPGSDEPVPQGWGPTTLPQFRGWAMNPRLVNLFDDFNGSKRSSMGDAIGKVNRAIVSSIFINPISALVGHGGNITWHSFMGRGFENIKVHTYPRQLKNAYKAIMDVATMGPRYQAMMGEGAPLMYAPIFTRDYHQAMISAMLGEMKKNPEEWKGIAHAAGTTTAAMYKALSTFSSKGLWAYSDILTLQRIYDLMDKGLSVREAITRTGQEIPDYRIPTEAWEGHGGREFAEFMKNSNITMFGKYHYGMIRAFADAAKRTFGRKSNHKDRVEGVGQFLALAALMAFIVPAGDKLWQKMTGNKDARVRRQGPATVIDNLERAASNPATGVPAAIGSVIRPAPGVKSAIELGMNRNLFTGRHIYSSFSELAQDLGFYAADQLAPVQQTAAELEGKKTLGGIGASMVGVNLPEPGATAKAKKYEQGDVKRDTTASRRRDSRLEHSLGIK